MKRRRLIDLEKIRKELDVSLTFCDFSKASKLVEKGLKAAMEMKNKFYQFFFKSQREILNENYQRAVFYLNKALKVNPYDEECYNDKSLCLVDLGKTDEALQCIDEGLKICRESKLLYHNRGWIFLQMGQYMKARGNFLKALEFDEKNSVCWANLAECFKQEAEFYTALKYYRKALTLIPYRYRDLRQEISEEIERLSNITRRK